MDGNPFRVRTFKFGDKTKKTLVMFGPINGSALLYVSIFSELAERYRVIAVEHGSHGMNTRLAECSGYASYEAAEEWLADWTQKVFVRLDLPEKFYLLGICFGCHLVCRYASTQPHRVEKLFLASPMVRPIDLDWDPYTYPVPSWRVGETKGKTN